MLLINIDKTSTEPAFKQISGEVARHIQKGILKDGDKLPSSRILANMLGVNRTTVIKAYEELWALGYIVSRPGSYSFVRTRKELVNLCLPEEVSTLIASLETNTGTTRMYQNGGERLVSLNLDPGIDVIDFSRLEIDTRLIPIDDIRRYASKLLTEQNRALFGYENPYGNELLRKHLAERLQLHGIEASTNEILVTNGSNHSLDLVLRTFLNPGDTVVIEAPTYQLIPHHLRYYRANVIEIPMLSTGMDLDALERVARRHQVKFIYSIPNMHNPSGISTSQEHRERLLGICEKYGIYLIEDGYEEEMKYFGKVHLPIKSMDKNKIVFYIGSLSKVFSPGFRTGWLVAHPHYIDKICTIKHLNDIASNTFTQMLAAQLLKENYLDVYIKRNNRITKRRMISAIKALNELAAKGLIQFQPPLGGYLLWLKINHPYRLTDWESRLLKYGVCISDGKKFFYGKPDANYIRLSIMMLDEEQIVEGIRRIGKCLEDMRKQK